MSGHATEGQSPGETRSRKRHQQSHLPGYTSQISHGLSRFFMRRDTFLCHCQLERPKAYYISKVEEIDVIMIENGQALLFVLPESSLAYTLLVYLLLAY